MKLVTTRHAIDHKPIAADLTIIDVPTPDCPDNGVLARVVYLSLDPYIGSVLRGRHLGHHVPTPMQDALPAAAVAQVLESKTSGFSKGDWIYCQHASWQEVIAVPASEIRKINPDLAPLSAYAGVLGMPGLTAWASMTRLAKVHDGDVVLVDAAAGPVGGTVGQIARIKGASKVVGIAGGDTKCQLVADTYSFDACVDYKTADWQSKLSEVMPEGCSVFHENVSADMAMIALDHSQLYARGVLCGLVDAYHSEVQSQHALNAGFIIGKRAQLLGLVVYDFFDQWDVFVEETSAWIRSGQLKFVEDRAEGLEAAPQLFERLMAGQNIGKTIVAVDQE